MDARNEHPLKMTLNGREINRLVIDQHYKAKHRDMDDRLIVSLVKTLDGDNYPIEMENDGFEYFTVEPVEYLEKNYRLVLVMCITEDFLGVINAFRVRRKNDKVSK